MSSAEVQASKAVYSVAATEYAGQLIDMMTEEDAQMQFTGVAPSSTGEDIRQDIRAVNPDKLVFSGGLVYRYDRLAAIRGAGYTMASDVPTGLVSRIVNNEDFFWMDTLVKDEEYHLSSGTFLMNRDRFIERFAHRYDIVGAVSREEYAEYDTKEEII